MKKIMISAFLLASSLLATLNLQKSNRHNTTGYTISMMNAQAQDFSEDVITWEAFATATNWIDDQFFPDSEWVDNFNNHFWSLIHFELDQYNVSGDSVSEWQQDPDGNWHSVEVDSCDGQPRFC